MRTFCGKSPEHIVADGMQAGEALADSLASVLYFFSFFQGLNDQQVLKSNLGDIVTLDLRRITSKGIVSGTSFKVPTLAPVLQSYYSTTLYYLQQLNF